MSSVCWRSSGTPKTSIGVYFAWLAWLGATLWVAYQTLQDALDGRASYFTTLGLAAVAGLLSIPLLNRVSVVNLLILVPVWLFGAGYSLFGTTLPAYRSLGAFYCYAGALIVGGLVMWGWERMQKRKPPPPAAGAEQG